MANCYSRNVLPSYCVVCVTVYVVFDCLYTLQLISVNTTEWKVSMLGDVDIL
jgi:hypothetical protein